MDDNETKNKKEEKIKKEDVVEHLAKKVAEAIEYENPYWGF